jgi:hypothetical protein
MLVNYSNEDRILGTMSHDRYACTATYFAWLATKEESDDGTGNLNK